MAFKWKGKKIDRKKLFLGIIALLIAGGMILGAVARFGFEFPSSGPDQLDRSEEEVIATVNGEEITWGKLKVQLNYLISNYEAQGIDLQDEEMQDFAVQSQHQVLDNMIGHILMLQEAKKKGIGPSKDDVQERYQQFVDEFQGEEDVLIEQLEMSGYTMKELMEDIALELTLQEYIEYVVAERLGEEELVISEEESKELFEQYAAHDGDLSYEEVKPEIEKMLKEQKKQEILQELIQELRQNSDIEIYL